MITEVLPLYYLSLNILLIKLRWLLSMTWAHEVCKQFFPPWMTFPYMHSHCISLLHFYVQHMCNISMVLIVSALILSLPEFKTLYRLHIFNCPFLQWLTTVKSFCFLDRPYLSISRDWVQSHPYGFLSEMSLSLRHNAICFLNQLIIQLLNLLFIQQVRSIIPLLKYNHQLLFAFEVDKCRPSHPSFYSHPLYSGWNSLLTFSKKCPLLCKTVTIYIRSQAYWGEINNQPTEQTKNQTKPIFWKEQDTHYL